MKRALREATAITAVLAVVLSASVVSALASGDDTATYGYLAGRQRSNDRYTEFEQAAELTSDTERGAFFQETGIIGYTMKDRSAYIYGASLSGGNILYISTPLAAVDILRSQLLRLTALSLNLRFLIARAFSKRFVKPVADLSVQAGHLAGEDFYSGYEAGFCAELDDLSQTLQRPPNSLTAEKCPAGG